MLRRFSLCLFQFSYFTVLVISGILLSLLTGQMLYSQTYIPLRIAEGVEFLQHPWYFYPLLLVFLFLLVKARTILNKVSSTQLFTLFSLIYLIAGVYLISQSSGVIRADAKHVFNAALAFNQGDYSSLTRVGSYMYRNPHQLGLMTLERLYALISPTTQFVFVINLVLILGINFLIAKISYLLIKSDMARKYSICLTFLFLPQFFFLLFLYGTTPGLFACLVSLYYFIHYDRQGKWFHLLGAALAIGVACILRNNYIIFALMLLAIEILSFFRKWSWKQPLAILAILLSVTFSSKAVTSYYEGVIGQKIGEGTPKIAYVTMGLRDDPNRQTLGGWYDAYNTKILKRNNYDEKKATEMAIKHLRKRLFDFITNPAYAFHFFYQKVKSTWTEPTFQSIWTGPQLEREQYTYTPLLQSIYEEKQGYQAYNLYTALFLTATYLFSAFFIIYKLFWHKKFLSSFELASWIFLLGGFLFHFFWETKSQYVYIYVLLLIPTFAQGLDKIGRSLSCRS